MAYVDPIGVPVFRKGDAWKKLNAVLAFGKVSGHWHEEITMLFMWWDCGIVFHHFKLLGTVAAKIAIPRGCTLEDACLFAVTQRCLMDTKNSCLFKCFGTSVELMMSTEYLNIYPQLSVGNLILQIVLSLQAHCIRLVNFFPTTTTASFRQ